MKNIFDKNSQIKPGQIRYVDFGEETECLQGGVRPALISQNTIGCLCSPIIKVIPLTSNVKKAKTKNLPMHIFVPKTAKNGLKCDSVVLTEQERPIHRKHISDCIGTIEDNIIYRCAKAIVENSSLLTLKDMEDGVRVAV